VTSPIDRVEDAGFVVLHIGLPKTGTTHLQHLIFARTPELRFLHRTRGSAAERGLCRSLRQLVVGQAAYAAFERWRFARALRAIAGEGRPVLLSYENVAMAPNGIWTGRGPGPEQVAARLAGLGSKIAPLRLKVVLGIRRQDRWLASRYAESSRDFPGFDQADFDARLSALAAAAELKPVEAWLDHDRAHEALAGALGAENVFLLPTERLRQEAVYHELGRFAGGVNLLRWHRRAAKRTALRPRNTLSGGGDTWQLRRDGSLLTLSPELAAALRHRFADSSQRLSARGPLGLAASLERPADPERVAAAPAAR